MIGRIFVILGMKNSELEGTARLAETSMKARAMFQGNNVRTKTQHPRMTFIRKFPMLQLPSRRQDAVSPRLSC